MSEDAAPQITVHWHHVQPGMWDVSHNHTSQPGLEPYSNRSESVLIAPVQLRLR